ncbi:ribonuclease 3 [Stenotrophomonas ginsengisoli]|uniref:Ribonuclease 3 n=1 Tax=Stenotrophomonas ginsengisoli TaxID=336566 RepID=A0A0R0DFQ7_9GAMM|nr:ribonuclease III [Stenotrophomonas ginsengisoli]KRG76878.1 ribonuclease 3 [Stenotrophomonas ginsengisoli]
MKDRISHRFADPALLAQALRHRSAGVPHNERLEFLGDSIVNMLVAQTLFERWPKADEGALTRARSTLVCEGALAVIARQLELGPRLVLGPGELKSGGFRRDSILADAVEAVIAAIYLDAGFDACRQVVLPWFEASIAALPATGKPDKDPKTRLQEWLQARQKPLPHYELISESGDDHAKHFHVRCTLVDPTLASEGEGTSRRIAEQQAAAAALALLEPK